MTLYATERGNILFLILLAVVLFAALSYAVTSSVRGGGSDATKEKAATQAADIINYANLLEQTVTRLRLSGGCSLSQINFENATVTGYANASAPADDHCDVFSPLGGGVSWKTPDTAWLEPTATAAAYLHYNQDYGTFNFPSNVCVQNLNALPSCSNSSPSEKQMVLGLKYLTYDICNEINTKLSVTVNLSSQAGCSPAGDNAKYTGSFAAGTYSCGGVSISRRTACIYSSRTGYTFYHVLATQ